MTRKLQLTSKYSIFIMLKLFIGGNQRDLARAKNQKKQQDLTKGKKTDGLTVEQRKFR